MAQATESAIGATASCPDGVRGEVSPMIVDPAAPAVPHLVIEPKHRREPGRLAPFPPGRHYGRRCVAGLRAVRPARPGDFDAVREMYIRMSPDNLYLRFRASISEVAAALAALTGEPHPLATAEGW